MKFIKRIKSCYLKQLNNIARNKLLDQSLISTVDPTVFQHSLEYPNAYYRRAFQDFHCALPTEIREHRAYFSVENRGFGEDAFHTMWWHLIRNFKPLSFLEIGVYRGQTISLVSLISKLEGITCTTHGISPFSSAGDKVSKYLEEIDYLEDTLENFRYFSLPEPELLKAYSTDDIAIERIREKKWDCIYIDGNHDYEVVKKDWDICSENTNVGGIIILDDSGLDTSYRPPRFATGGHPGPSKLAGEIDPIQFREILQVGHNRVFKRIF